MLTGERPGGTGPSRISATVPSVSGAGETPVEVVEWRRRLDPDASEVTTKRARRKLNPDELVKVRSVRQASACLRCHMMKEPVRRRDSPSRPLRRDRPSPAHGVDLSRSASP